MRVWLMLLPTMPWPHPFSPVSPAHFRPGGGVQQNGRGKNACSTGSAEGKIWAPIETAPENYGRQPFCNHRGSRFLKFWRCTRDFCSSETLFDDFCFNTVLYNNRVDLFWRHFHFINFPIMHFLKWISEYCAVKMQLLLFLHPHLSQVAAPPAIRCSQKPNYSFDSKPVPSQSLHITATMNSARWKELLQSQKEQFAFFFPLWQNSIIYNIRF